MSCSNNPFFTSSQISFFDSAENSPENLEKDLEEYIRGKSVVCFDLDNIFYKEFVFQYLVTKEELVCVENLSVAVGNVLHYVLSFCKFDDLNKYEF